MADQVQGEPGAALFGDEVALEERAAGDELAGVGDPPQQGDRPVDQVQPGGAPAGALALSAASTACLITRIASARSSGCSASTARMCETRSAGRDGYRSALTCSTVAINSAKSLIGGV